MPKTRLDRLDLRILDALLENAQISNVALAERVGLTPSPCLRRVRRMKEAGVIQSTLTVLSYSAVGLEIQALIQIGIERHGEDECFAFEESIKSMPEVLACYLVSGATDYILQVVSQNVSSYTKLVKKIAGLPGIREIQSCIVLETVKPWSIMSLKHLESERINAE